MATNNQLKFYRLGTEAMASKVVKTGAIWFNTDDKTIQIKTASGWDKYAGKLNDAQWDTNKQKLTISKYDGSSIELDFSDIASGSSVSAALSTLETKLQGEIVKIETAVGLADDGTYVAPSGATFTGTSSVKTALEALDAAISRVSGDLTGGISERVDAVEDAIEALEAKDTELGNAITDITKADGAIATAVAEEAAIARAAEQAAEASAAAALAAAQGAQSHSEGVAGNLATEVSTRESEISRVEGLVTAEAGRADAAEKANAASAKSAQDAAEAAQDYAEGVNSALEDEVSRATSAEDALGDRITLLDAATTGRVSVLEGKVDALSSATHFVGVKDELPTSGVDGDIVIVGNKEYIYDSTQDPKWIELGDTTAESGRISALESWKTEASQDIIDLGAEIDAVAKDLADNYATDAELQALADGAVKANANKIAEIEAEVDLNTTAVTNYKTRIESLEATSNALGTTYVKVSDYNTDKQAFEQKHADLQGEIDAADGRLDTAEADIDDLEAATGFVEGYVANADSNYIKNATSLKSADDLLDAEILKVRTELGDVAASITNKNVDASGDTYVNAVAANNKVTVSTNVKTLAEAAEAGDAGVTGLATTQDVYNALC